MVYTIVVIDDHVNEHWHKARKHAEEKLGRDL